MELWEAVLGFGFCFAIMLECLFTSMLFDQKDKWDFLFMEWMNERMDGWMEWKKSAKRPVNAEVGRNESNQGSLY